MCKIFYGAAEGEGGCKTNVNRFAGGQAFPVTLTLLLQCIEKRTLLSTGKSTYYFFTITIEF